MAAKVGMIVWVGRVLSFLVSLMFVMSGMMKLSGAEAVKTGMAAMGMSESLIVPLAILELTCVLIYMIPQTAILGAILLTGYLGGAICTHLRLGEAFYFQTGMGVVVWLGLYLREARLRSLIPVRFSTRET